MWKKLTSFQLSLFIFIVFIASNFSSFIFKDEEPSVQVISSVTSTYPSGPEKTAINSINNEPQNKVERTTPIQINQVSLPAGAISIETMIANLEQEKKEAAKLSIENPFKVTQ